MWYRKDEISLDEPIVAICKATEKLQYLLVPNQKGCFDWLKIDSGKYNSLCGFKTAQDAMDCYQKDFYFRNAQIIAEPF